MIDLHLRLRRSSFRLDVSARLDSAATGIFGPSGSGKSSLLHALAGLLPVEELRLTVNGEMLVDTASGRMPAAHLRRIGMVFQDHRLFPHLTVADNLRYGLPKDGAPGPTWREVIELLDIGELLGRRPDQCSGGQRQRVALGRALLSAPRLLLLDEPLASLDRGLKRQILPYLRRARDAFAMPLLHVSHDLPELLHVCDDLLLIDGGRIAAHGPLGAIAGDAKLLPLLHDAGMVNVLRGTITTHEPPDGLTLVTLDGGARVRCPLRGEAVGSRIELLLRPDEVALATADVTGISLQNRLPGRIRAITAASDRVLVAVDLGQDVLVEVTARTVQQLGLSPGQPIWILFKAMSLAARG